MQCTHMQGLHDSAQPVLVGLERQKLVVAVARVVEHPTAGVEELPQVRRLRHLRAEPDLAAGLPQLLPDHFQLLVGMVHDSIRQVHK